LKNLSIPFCLKWRCGAGARTEEREFITSIQTLLQNDVLISPYPYLKIGQRVRIVNGPLMGCEGILLREKPNKERLIISIDLLKRSVCAEIDGADVEPI